MQLIKPTGATVIRLINIHRNIYHLEVTILERCLLSIFIIIMTSSTVILEGMGMSSCYSKMNVMKG